MNACETIDTVKDHLELLFRGTNAPGVDEPMAPFLRHVWVRPPINVADGAARFSGKAPLALPVEGVLNPINCQGVTRRQSERKRG